MMNFIPYKVVAIMYLVGVFFVGGLIVSGASMIKEMGRKQGAIEVYMGMPIHVLSELEI